MEKLGVVLIRSLAKTSGDIRLNVAALGLDGENSCIVIDKTPENMGRLNVANSVLTYGEISVETLKKLLKKRAAVSNSKQYVFEDDKLDSFATDFIAGKVTLDAIGIKKVFYLHPPIRGFERKGKKVPFTLNGAFGYRGDKINALLDKMI